MVDRRRRPDEDGSGLADEERRLFEEEMRGVRRIERERAVVVPAAKPPAGPAPRVLPPAPLTSPLRVETSGEQVSAFDPGVPSAMRRALRQGRRRPEATLDLHGLRVDAATRRLDAFIQRSRAAGRRCLLVVTGRGLRSGPAGPVLRHAVVERLTEGPIAGAVLGLVTAPPGLGGAGALLVLLGVEARAGSNDPSPAVD
jgi:DNA-nicking Smr family endonuclease